MFIINIRLQNIGKTVENQPMTYDLSMYRVKKPTIAISLTKRNVWPFGELFFHE